MSGLTTRELRHALYVGAKQNATVYVEDEDLDLYIIKEVKEDSENIRLQIEKVRMPDG